MTEKTSVKLLIPMGFKQIIQAAANDKGLTMAAFCKMAIARELQDIGTIYCDPEGEVADHASI